MMPTIIPARMVAAGGNFFRIRSSPGCSPPGAGESARFFFPALARRGHFVIVLCINWALNAVTAIIAGPFHSITEMQQKISDLHIAREEILPTPREIHAELPAG